MRKGDEGCRVVVGERLKALRLGRGLTQAKLAEPLGLTFQQIHKYESGASDLSISRLLGLARVLGVPPSLLLDAPPPEREVFKPVNRLGSFRRDRRLRRRLVADAAGLSDQHLAGLEAGTAELTVNWLIRLSRILGCHPWDLVDPTYRPMQMPPPRRSAGHPRRTCGRTPSQASV
jgi:transcriptional regulator with XRE-family HTH domain